CKFELIATSHCPKSRKAQHRPNAHFLTTMLSFRDYRRLLSIRPTREVRMSPTRWIIGFMCVFSSVSSGLGNPLDWKQALQFGLSQYFLGHLAESEAPLRLALEGAREHGDKVATAAVLTDLGALYLAEDRFADAEEVYGEALSIYKKTPSPQIGVVVALRGLG